MKELFCGFAIVGAFFGFLFLVATGLTAYTCNGYEVATGKPTRMISATCYIKEGVSWYAWDEYKYRLATKGEFEQFTNQGE